MLRPASIESTLPDRRAVIDQSRSLPPTGQNGLRGHHEPLIGNRVDENGFSYRLQSTRRPAISAFGRSCWRAGSLNWSGCTM
ncbi:hypothetical protein D7Y33_06615 [Stenotrophomonas maltophilia]|uniref:Uncharacterized protein n=1 Tax=Stenotrophomonas maltophilia TaxID=40324 RepID=A0AAW3S210_STEMA|nr:hypothetical protein [Stenotrophomonas maltophilia]